MFRAIQKLMYSVSNGAKEFSDQIKRNGSVDTVVPINYKRRFINK